MKPALPILLLCLAAVRPAAVAARGEVSAEDRAWWSFQPVQKPVAPAVRTEGWARTPVDFFILSRLEKEGLEPAAEASREVLARRVYFDLLGLPPSREEVEEFVNDRAPDAWERLVDRLLASPHYGERQARHWLDLVRYAESDGYRADDYRPDAWRYRDYVIDAMNGDTPYDRFIQEQLAGDELFPGDPRALVATGYLRHWIYEYNNRDVADQWSIILNDITDTTADVFMGLGLQCARCHDHKFDPLLQRDYYRLQSVFSALLPRDGTPVIPAAAVEEWRKRQAAWEEATAAVRAEIAALREPWLEKGRAVALALFPPETRELLAKPDAERTPYERQIGALAQRQVAFEEGNADGKIKGEDKARLVALRKELSKQDGLRPVPPAVAPTVADVGADAPPRFIPRREKDGPIEPGAPTILEPAALTVHSDGVSTGRRAAFAQWLTRPENPLTARVMVNRVWRQHFGRGLSDTTSDFGRLGERPTHPELLDWLAARFMEDGWSLKKLHRLILTSAVWKQSHVSPAAVAEHARVVDPENRLLWRMNTRRLEAEPIRDAIFAASGELDLTAGGPPADQSKPRRAVYTKVLRNVRDPLTDVFDAPQNFNSSPTRDTTTTAVQSLFLVNSRFMTDRAEAMAERLLRDNGGAGDVRRMVEDGWWRAAGRAPRTEELEESLAFLQEAEAAAPPEPENGKAGGLIAEAMPQRPGQAAVIAPGSTQERLAAAGSAPDGDFTAEAVVLARSVYTDGGVRNIAGQWDGDHTHPGWTLGLTGKKSRRAPLMLVLQLTGPDKTEKVVNEPVFSDLILQTDRSYYTAAAVHFDPEGKGTVTFYVKDLSNDDEPLRTASVPHPLAAGFLPASLPPLFLGDSDAAPGGQWDGLIDEVRLSRGMLPEDALALKTAKPDARTAACWAFEPETGALTETVSGTAGITPPPPRPGGSARKAALTDWCHAMLTSSSLLYVE